MQVLKKVEDQNDKELISSFKNVNILKKVLENMCKVTPSHKIDQECQCTPYTTKSNQPSNYAKNCSISFLAEQSKEEPYVKTSSIYALIQNK